MGKRKWYMIPVLVLALLSLAAAACRITDSSDPNPQIRPGLDGSGTFPSFTTGGVERPTQTNGTEDDMTEPENSSDPSGEATEPTEPGVEGTQPSNPGNDVTEPSGEATDPTEEKTDPTEPGTQPTEPVTEPTEPTTDPTEPVTDPTEPTDPAPTEPDPTEPTEPPHSHDFSSKVTAPTCTEKGYTTYTCKTCGYSYKGNETAAKGHSYKKTSTKKPTCTEKGYSTYRCDACGDTYIGDEKPATGHSYSSKVVKPTCGEQGYTQYTCSACNHSYKGSYTAATGNHTLKGEWVILMGMPYQKCSVCSNAVYYDFDDGMDLADPALSFEAAVAEAFLKYINEYRVAEGVPALEYLPGMSQVAQYRSRQLVSDFSHNTADIREATAFYEYGRYIDWAEAGCPELVDQNYWTYDGTEAIGYHRMGGATYSLNNMAKALAKGCYESAGHWSYVGSAEYSYAGVGITCDPVTGHWYVCIMVGRTNYG